MPVLSRLLPYYVFVYFARRSVNVGVGVHALPENKLVLDFARIKRHVAVLAVALSFEVEVVGVVVMLNGKVRLGVARLLIGIGDNTELVRVAQDFFRRERVVQRGAIEDDGKDHRLGAGVGIDGACGSVAGVDEVSRKIRYAVLALVLKLLGSLLNSYVTCEEHSLNVLPCVGIRVARGIAVL